MEQISATMQFQDLSIESYFIILADLAGSKNGVQEYVKFSETQACSFEHGILGDGQARLTIPANKLVIRIRP